MIRIHTDHALGRKFRRERKDWADRAAEAIETLRPQDCPHANNRPTCGRCGERRTVEAALKMVRETGGLT